METKRPRRSYPFLRVDVGAELAKVREGKPAILTLLPDSTPEVLSTFLREDPRPVGIPLSEWRDEMKRRGKSSKTFYRCLATLKQLPWFRVLRLPWPDSRGRLRRRLVALIFPVVTWDASAR